MGILNKNISYHSLQNYSMNGVTGNLMQLITCAYHEELIPVLQAEKDSVIQNQFKNSNQQIGRAHV